MILAADLVKDLDTLPQPSSLNATVPVDSLPVLILTDFRRVRHLPWASLMVAMVIMLSRTKVRARLTWDRRVC